MDQNKVHRRIKRKNGVFIGTIYSCMRVLLLLLCFTSVSACGPPPPCCGPPPSLDCCKPPEINATITPKGVDVSCPDATCAFVNEELDPSPCGCTFTHNYTLDWSDARIGQCLYTEKDDDDQVLQGTIRWWSYGCMGHVDLVLRIRLREDMRDIFIDYPEFECHEQVGVHTGYVALAKTGSNDDIPQAEVSDLYFEVTMEEPIVGVHMEITSCDVDILDSGASDAVLLTTYENINYNVSYADPNGERATFRAFMDSQYYSPYQRVRCVYAMFNGTTSLDTFSHSQSYMLVNPFDSGVIQSS